MNKVFFIGNLTRDPELSETLQGVSVCRFGLAVNRKQPSGEKTADFYNVTAFRGLAETIAKYSHKGDRIALLGDIQLRNYEGNDGVRRLAVDIIAQDIEFINSARTNNGEDFYDASPSPAQGGAPARKKPALQSFDDDGDIPF